MAKISNCRHEIARWRKNNPPYRKEKISELQKALEEVQSDDTRSQEDIVEVSRKLQEAYKDEEEYWQQKNRNMSLQENNVIATIIFVTIYRFFVAIFLL